MLPILNAWPGNEPPAEPPTCLHCGSEELEDDRCIDCGERAHDPERTAEYDTWAEYYDDHPEHV